VASPMIVILMALDVSIMLLENIYSTGFTHDDRHIRSSYFYSTATSHVLKLFCPHWCWVKVSCGVGRWRVFQASIKFVDIATRGHNKVFHWGRLHPCSRKFVQPEDLSL
jgi:hypothetical protein